MDINIQTPSNMRSKYWKYFGFPANDQNTIISRKKIICKICRTSIAYNRNTSNLRTHLMAKHSEVLLALFNNKETNDLEDDHGDDFQELMTCAKMSKTNGDNNNYSTELIFNSTENRNVNSNNHHVHLTVNHDVNDEGDDDDNEDVNEITMEYNIEHFMKEQQKDIEATILKYDFEDVNDNECEGSIENIEDNSLEIYTNHLIKDLLSINGTRVKNEANFNKISLDQSLLNKYHQQQEFNNDIIKSLMQNECYHYSLSIEVYENFEKLNIVNVYINFQNEQKLQSLLYLQKIINVHQFKDNNSSNCYWSKLLVEFELSRCVAIIVASNSIHIIESLQSWGHICNIPVIKCLEFMINHCLNEIFKVDAVDAAIHELLLFIDQNEEFAPGIEYFGSCAWSKLNYLNGFVEHFPMETYEKMDKNEIKYVFDICAFVEFLYPLKLLMESVVDESTPLCSIIIPLVERLYSEMKASTNEIVCKANEILMENINQSIISNDFLLESMFFDLRFTMKKEQSDKIIKNLWQRYQFLATPETFTQEMPQKQQVKSKGLKLFFERTKPTDISTVDDQLENNSPAYRSFNMEVQNYLQVQQLSLDKCPLLWWENHKNNYKILYKISQRYMTAPCSVNRLFSLEPELRLKTYHKRYLLCQMQNERHLWFLHYNATVLNELKMT